MTQSRRVGRPTMQDKAIGAMCAWPPLGRPGFTVRAFCEWSIATCLLHGASLETAYKVASEFARDPFLHQLERSAPKS